MKALILNSGIGTRMGDLTKSKPKCMTEIGNGHTIISWQLALLKAKGITEIIMTTGPFEKELINYIDSLNMGLDIKYINNPLYAKTNYIYSMYLAGEYVYNSDIILLHGDLVLEGSVMDDLVHSHHSAVMIEKEGPLPEKDFKARIKQGLVTEIGVNIFDDCYASQPAYKFMVKDFALWMNEIVKYCQADNRKVYAEEALNAISHKIKLYPLEIRGRLCQEIDTMQDMETVRGKFSELFA